MKIENHACKSPALYNPCEPWNCIECGQSFSGTVIPMQVFRETDSDFGEYAIIVVGVLVACFLGIVIGFNLSKMFGA